MLALMPVNFGQVFFVFQLAPKEAAHHRISEAACLAERGTKACIDQLVQGRRYGKRTGTSTEQRPECESAYQGRCSQHRGGDAARKAPRWHGKTDRKNQNSSAKR
jgi:hypothetical protein